MLKMLNELRKIGSWTMNGFKVIFVACPLTEIKDVVHLKNAIESNFLEISEVSASGSVNALKVVNKSSKFIIGFRGDILVGGKQNRTLFTTIIIAPNSENIIPVSCVEAGRWSWKTRTMRQSLRVPQLMKMENLLMELSIPSRSELTRASVKHMIQSKTWKNVDLRMHNLGVISETSDIVEVVSKQVKGEVEINIPENANGVICVYDGKIIGGEIYFIPVDEEYLRATIIAAYFDYEYYKGTKKQISTGMKSIEEVFEALSKCTVEDKESLFAERVKILKSDKVAGYLTLYNGKPIYLEFTAPKLVL